MNSQQFHEHFGENANYWAEDPDYTVAAWQDEVGNDDTRLGYWDWVLVQRGTT